jgi:hypothetical protein
MTTTRILELVRARGQDAYQILLIEYTDKRLVPGRVALEGDITSRVLTEHGWFDFDALRFESLPYDLPYITGLDLHKQTRRFARRLTKRRFTRLMQELAQA